MPAFPPRRPATAFRHLLLLLLLVTGWPASAAEPRVTNDVICGTAGDRQLHLDLCLPESGAGPFPLLVWIHGGGWRAGSRRDFAEGMRGMAAQGYANAALEYRFAPGARWPAQLDDLQQALRYLVANAKSLNLDPQRTALIGGSAGGHLVLMLGFVPEQVPGVHVRAIINFAGPTQLGLFTANPAGDAQLTAGGGPDARHLVSDLLGSEDRSAVVYATASPLTYVRPGLPPVLTIHGIDDVIVPVSQAEALHAALRRAGVVEHLIRGAKGGHDLSTWPEATRNLALLTFGMFLNQHVVQSP